MDFDSPNNDSADMFDRLLIKLVDNTFYEIRLPSYQFGQNLVDLFEISEIQKGSRIYNDIKKEGIVIYEK